MKERKVSLEKITLCYLAFPWLIFVLGWFRPWLGILSVGILIGAIFLGWRKLDASPSDPWIAAGLIALCWTILCWSGGYGGANLSWLKSHALLTDLTLRSWPVAYMSKTPAGFSPLVNEIAYQLPAAALGKWMGMTVAEAALFLWTLLGATLSFLWLIRLVQGVYWKILILFIVLGGMDWIGDVLYSNHIFEGTHWAEDWSSLWMYISNTGLFFSFPAHALSGWILAGCWMDSLQREKEIGPLLLIWILSALWSLPVAVGFTPFVGVAIYIRRSSLKLEKFIALIPAVFLILVLGFYYFSKHPLFPFHWMAGREDVFVIWPKLIWFYLVEFGFFAYLSQRKMDKNETLWRRVSLAILLIGPWLVGGEDEGGMALVVIPALFVFWIFVMRSFGERKNDFIGKIFTLCILIGSFSAVSAFSKNLAYSKWKFPDLLETRRTSQINRWPPASILGEGHSIFFSYFSKDFKGMNFAGRLYSTMADQAEAIIDAENYGNATRIEFRQNLVWARGGMIVNNGFGSIPGDSLDYNFKVNNSLDKYRVTVIYATEQEGAELKLEVDGTSVGSLACASTQEWWEFRHASLDLASLSSGTHTLKIISNGININLDSILVSSRESTHINIEAEAYTNKTRLNHIQEIPPASGGAIVANGFGSSPKDVLKYSFHWETPARVSVVISYATERSDASYDLLLDGNQKGSVHFMKTPTWGSFQTASFSLGTVAAGPHELSLQSNGANVNFDHFGLWAE